MNVPLAFSVTGIGEPLVILHGLFGSGRNWSNIARSLSNTWRVLTPDLRNHGASPWSPDMSYPALADDVRRLMADNGVGSAVVAGHSMGGKVAMALALHHPALVRRLIVVDIAPIAYKHTLITYAHAMAALDLRRLESRADADRLLSAAIPEAAIRSFLLQNLLREDGRWKWRINLDALTRSMAAISGTAGLEGTALYIGPTLFMRGERSDYIKHSAEAVIEQRFPNAGLVTIAGAGHWLHAEQPQAFIETLSAWLAESGAN